MISIKGSNSYCPFLKFAQYFGVRCQKKDLKNPLNQVTLAVCHKEGVLFDPQFQKSFVDGYHHVILAYTVLLLVAAACLDGRVGGIEHAPEAIHALPVVCTSRLLRSFFDILPQNTV